MIKMGTGAKIIVQKWIKIAPWDKLLIVTTEDHLKEAKMLQKCASRKTKKADLMIVEQKGPQIGVVFDKNEKVFDGYTAIIGATDYSLVTTKAAKRAIDRRKKYLSLPLMTNNGVSMLKYDFLKMDTKKSRMMAQIIMKYLRRSTVIRITTPLGTNLRLYKHKREPGFFNGVVRDGKGYSSASIEVYIPIEETRTQGTMILDGSLGYIGKVTEPTKIIWKDGRITEIEQTPSGKKLKKYMESYQDQGIYVGGELGIGLNSLSHCDGNCYIEDESAYGTFHIGVGRNIALGGIHEANGHFDLVCKEPDIYADNRKLMERGKIILPEPQLY